MVVGLRRAREMVENVLDATATGSLAYLYSVSAHTFQIESDMMSLFGEMHIALKETPS